MLHDFSPSPRRRRPVLRGRRQRLYIAQSAAMDGIEVAQEILWVGQHGVSSPGDASLSPLRRRSSSRSRATSARAASRSSLAASRWSSTATSCCSGGVALFPGGVTLVFGGDGGGLFRPPVAVVGSRGRVVQIGPTFIPADAHLQQWACTLSERRRVPASAAVPGTRR